MADADPTQRDSRSYAPRTGPPTFRGQHRTKTTEYDLYMRELIEAAARPTIEPPPRNWAGWAEAARFKAWKEGEF